MKSAQRSSCAQRETRVPGFPGSALAPRVVFAICIVAVAAMPAANACTVCMGDSNSNFASASNAAIFMMFGAIGSMLAALSGFGFYLYKRASAPIPPHIHLVEEMSGDEGDQSHA